MRDEDRSRNLVFVVAIQGSQNTYEASEVLGRASPQGSSFNMAHGIKYPIGTIKTWPGATFDDEDM